MGGQNLNAPGRNPSGNPENKDTSVTARASPVYVAPSNQPNINGGQGKIGGPYGVQIIENKPNALGGPRTTGGGLGRSATPDNPYGVILSNPNDQANQYANSLIVNRGLSQNSAEFNTAFENYLQANKFVRDNSQSKNDSSPTIIKPSDKYDENYGYTGGVKTSPIISNNFSKNPTDVNFIIEGKSNLQRVRNAKNQGGGVETPQSKGKSFGSDFVSSSRQVIGAKTFSNQTELIRGTEKEQEVLKSEASRASQIYPSLAKGNPLTDTSQGGPQTKISQKIGSKGLAIVAPSSLVRNSPLEESVKSSEAIKASNLVKDNSKVGYEYGGGLGGLVDKNALQSTVLLQTLSKQSPLQEQQAARDNFESFFSAAQSKGSAINIYNAQGARIGSVKADEKGKQTLESLGDVSGIYFKEARSGQGFTSDRSFADLIQTLGSQGATINIVNSNKQVVGSVSGQNAYRDFISKFGKSNESLYAQPVFSTTREGKNLTNALIYGGVVNGKYVSGANNVGASGINVYVTSTKGKSPQVIEIIPANEKSISSAIDKYGTNPRISFGVVSKETQSPKDVNLIPASVTPLELNYISSKDFTGKYFDINQAIGGFLSQKSAETKLPIIPKNETINQFGISFPNPNLGLKELGSNLFSLIIVNPAKTIPPLLSGLGESYYNLFKTGTTGGPATKIESPKALANVIGQSLFEPQTFMSEKASQNYLDVSKFIHEKIGTSLREQGVKIPQPVEKPKTFGAFLGTAIGIGAMIPTELSPFGIGRIPLKVRPEIESPAFPSKLGGERSMSTSLTIGGKELISKTAGGIKLGTTKPEDLLPPEYQIAAKATRGEQYGTANKYAVSKLSSDEFMKYAENTGKAIPNTAEANKLFKGLQKSANEAGEGKKYLPEIPTTTEKVTSQVGKAILENNAKLNARINYLKVLSTGRGGIQQGSTITQIFTNPEVAKSVFSQFPAQDIDIRVGNPTAGQGGAGILGIDFSSKQAIAQATSAQTAIEVVQGIRRKEDVGFHATATRKEAESILKSPSTEESQRGGFFVMNRVDKIVPGYGNYLLKVAFNPKSVLKFKNLPKVEQLQVASKDWLKFQNNLMQKGLEKGYNIVQKPYYNTKKGAGTNPEAQTFETIFINPESLKSIKSIELLPNMQLTKAEKAHIVDLKTGEKLAEFTTEKDTENEIGSVLKPQGTLLGKNINYKVSKSPIQGSKIKGPHFGESYQRDTGLSQILAIQTKETLAQQGASQELINSIGNKFFIGPKLFGQGKEIVRTLGLFQTKAIELKSNPRTLAKGLQMEKDIARIKEIYGPLYGIDFTKPVTGKDFTPSASYFGKNPSGTSGIISSGKIISGIITGYGSQKSIKSDISKIPNSSISKISSKSKVSSISKISNISRISSGSSIPSGRSGKSGIPSFSGISGFSGPSGPSHPSGRSGKSGIPSFSGISGFSGPSGPSHPSGKSGPSGFSGLSSISGKSGIPSNPYSIYNTPNIPRILLPPFGAFTKRPRYRPKEGPTRTYLYNVKNPFASSLSIIESKKRR